MAVEQMIFARFSSIRGKGNAVRESPARRCSYWMSAVISPTPQPSVHGAQRPGAVGVNLGRDIGDRDAGQRVPPRLLGDGHRPGHGARLPALLGGGRQPAPLADLRAAEEGVRPVGGRHDFEQGHVRCRAGQRVTAVLARGGGDDVGPGPGLQVFRQVGRGEAVQIGESLGRIIRDEEVLS